MITINESGLVKVKIGATERDVDAYHAHNRIWELQQKNTDEENGALHKLHAGIVTLLDELGFPGATHYQASKFQAGIAGVVDQLGKAESGEPTPNSPASTEPAPSACPKESS